MFSSINYAPYIMVYPSSSFYDLYQEFQLYDNAISIPTFIKRNSMYVYTMFANEANTAKMLEVVEFVCSLTSVLFCIT